MVYDMSVPLMRGPRATTASESCVRADRLPPQTRAMRAIVDFVRPRSVYRGLCGRS
jgi:hypothetical protein